MADYRFVTTWELDAPIDVVFDTLRDYQSWPRWWRGVVAAAQVRQGDDRGVGGIASFRWRSRIPYTLEFDVLATHVRRPHLMRGTATGDLEGTGTWRLSQRAGGPTTVVYEWDVRTTIRWMNLIAPVAHGSFRRNHDWMMRRGGEGLAQLLEDRRLDST